MLKKELTIFMICLFIATLWWMIHQLNQTYIRQYHLNVYIVQIPEFYEQDSIYVSARIKVKGSGLKIILLENYFPERICIPFKKLKRLNKRNLFAIGTQNIQSHESFPVNIKITELHPDTLSINFKAKKKK